MLYRSLDTSDRVIAVLGGVPPGSSGEEWRKAVDEASEAVETFRENSTSTKAQQHGRRGNFAFRTVGFGYGNGRKQPLNFWVNGEENKRAVDDLLKNHAIRRNIAGFQQLHIRTRPIWNTRILISNFFDAILIFGRTSLVPCMLR
ncbi:hypothetical protein EV359DRAFT_82182 [Lentinula novae-zelandiae]|nr:hypothetical protein EV359DRAFT_82182 [Lentinula novae-zelandiae]